MQPTHVEDLRDQLTRGLRLANDQTIHLPTGTHEAVLWQEWRGQVLKMITSQAEEVRRLLIQGLGLANQFGGGEEWATWRLQTHQLLNSIDFGSSYERVHVGEDTADAAALRHAIFDFYHERQRQVTQFASSLVPSQDRGPITMDVAALVSAQESLFRTASTPHPGNALLAELEAARNLIRALVAHHQEQYLASQPYAHLLTIYQVARRRTDEGSGGPL